MKKQFPCGHVGLGRYCHRCRAEQERQTEENARYSERKAARKAWKESFHADPVNLEGHPRDAVEAARMMIKRIVDGEPLMALGAKPLHGGCGIYSVRVGYRYRLLCQRKEGRFAPIRFLSHESYNHDCNDLNRYGKSA